MPYVTIRLLRLSRTRSTWSVTAEPCVWVPCTSSSDKMCGWIAFYSCRSPLPYTGDLLLVLCFQGQQDYTFCLSPLFHSLSSNLRLHVPLHELANITPRRCLVSTCQSTVLYTFLIISLPCTLTVLYNTRCHKKTNHKLFINHLLSRINYLPTCLSL